MKLRVVPQREDVDFRAPRLPIFWLLDWGRNQVTGRTLNCPYCDEPIRPKAIACPHCQRSLCD